MEERFLQLVKETKGFEYCQAYREEVDHIMGGKEGKVWFAVAKDGSVRELYMGEQKDGVWTDCLVKGRGKKRTKKDMPPGSTIKLIEERAYLMQDEEWVKNRKPRLVTDSDPHYHYVYGMGDKALDVSEKYGVSTGYSDLSDASAGFHIRYIYVGDEVEFPE